MGASLAFGVVGILFVLTLSENDNDMSDLSKILQRLLFICVFIILPSFALSVATKYLNGKS
jgi:Na+/H+ antiporter NhaA